MNRLFNRILLITVLALSAQWATAQSESYFLHTVTKGQGLYSISRMYGVTEADIISLNPGSEVVIKAGEQLRIPQVKKSPATVEPQQQGTANERFHTIKTGETLYRLTVIYGLTAREICNANPGLSAENFKVGQVVIIPEKKESQQEPTQPRVTEPNPLVSQTSKAGTPTPEVQRGRCRTEHKVKRRENIYRISRMYDITELELVNANPELRERKMRTGEILCIPYPDAQQPKQEPTPTKQEKKKSEPVIIPTDEALFAELKDEVQQIEQIS